MSDPTAAAAIRVFGEAVGMPNGAIAQGIFQRFDPVPRLKRRAGESDAQLSRRQAEVGRRMRLSQQPNPMVQLLPADAAALAENDALNIRGRQWRIARIDGSGFGLVRVSLAPVEG